MQADDAGKDILAAFTLHAANDGHSKQQSAFTIQANFSL